MKRFTLLAALTLLMATSATAQKKPFPDTLDWRGYYPLEVGNVWEYAGGHSADAAYERREITGDTLIDSTRYYVHVTRRYDDQKQPLGNPLVDYLRYDTVRTTVAAHAAGDSYPTAGWDPKDNLQQPWMGPKPTLLTLVTCSLSVDFGSKFTCGEEGDEGEVRVQGRYTKGRHYGPIVARSEKIFYAPGSSRGIHFLHGIGEELHVNYTYLHIGGKEWGESVVLSVNESEGPASKLRFVSAYPNPFRGRTTVAYEAPVGHEVAITVFDALGRVIRRTMSRNSQGGMRRLSVGNSDWSPGLYFIRLTDPASGKQVTRRVVSVR